MTSKKQENRLRAERIQIRGAKLLTMARSLKEESKRMKLMIHNMTLLAKQAEDYAMDYDLLGKNEEPEFTWTIGV